MGSMKLNLTCIVKPEENQFSALCLELDVASCGDTEEEAIDSLKDAIETYVVYMLEEGRERELFRPVSLTALRDFLTEEELEPTPRPFSAFPLEFVHAPA
ncbi:type II toxin-antitoxin system HicB family antitoxin [bacterium]|nr:type II toxin-antitoxin system HicB family antitoxin [bacterium]